jgi:spore coat polysaccharide biosynthesis protein SpsF (cytidylyltransferase family)
MGPVRGALAVVQARMSSSRLPGKTLADVDGEPMLALLLRRLEAARRLEAIVVATTTDSADEPVAELAGAMGHAACRGPREDVLSRFLAAIGDREEPIVRITGDCPLIDARVVDEVIERFESTPGCAYASNVSPRTFPDGLDVEVLDPRPLREIDEEALDPSAREHVTSAIRSQPERFRQASTVLEQDLSSLRWTVDEPHDLEFIREVVRRLGDRRYTADLWEVLACVRQEPSLCDFHGRRG